MTPTKLIAEARELDRRATPGPWIGLRAAYAGCLLVQMNEEEYLVSEQDMSFITRSRTLLPALCDALEQAQEDNKHLTKEVASLAIESVKREKTLARLEAEVMAAMNRRGEWTRKETNGGTLAICSQCKYPVSYWHKTKYCGECGANMEEVE